MGDSKLDEKEIFFEFPKSDIKGIPIIWNDNKLNFGFVEVGCRPNGKRIQLRDKKQLFYKYWADEYKKRFDISWIPDIYRTLIHYEPGQELNLDQRKLELDVVISYDFITNEMILSLTEQEKQLLCSSVSNKRKKNDLSEILNSGEAERFHDLIIWGGSVPELSFLRGKIAEIFALKDIQSLLPFGMNFYKNGDIKYFNKRYDNGTEIDGVLTFYSLDRFICLIDKLEKVEHLSVIHRWA